MAGSIGVDLSKIPDTLFTGYPARSDLLHFSCAPPPASI